MGNAKQTASHHTGDWYPYYAGYTESFVAEVIEAHMPKAKRIIDPWSGSGTTVAACVKGGRLGIGVDVNPVLTVIARARLAPPVEEDALRDLLGEARRGMDLPLEAREEDPLLKWVKPSAAQRIRSLQRVIDQSGGLQASQCYNCRVDTMSSRTALLYCSLFAATRDLLSRFRATNPTWVKEPVTHRNRIVPSWTAVETAFLRRVEFFNGRADSISETDGNRGELITNSATALPFPSDSFDGAVTSPPYATRIDYVKGVLPELAVLGVGPEAVAHLRRVSTGTPVVRGVVRESKAIHSSTALEIVKAIETHESKGSQSYYGPWIENYFSGLQRGIEEIARAVVPDGTIALVVQDSFYKTLHIDLQAIVAEMAKQAGRDLVNREDFTVENLRSRMNPRARRHLKERRNYESLLIFR